jgi:hypothetical protein
MTAMPSTYRPESSADSVFVFVFLAPKILTVIGMSGKTHGVKAVRSPRRNTAIYANPMLWLSAVLKSITAFYLFRRDRSGSGRR